MKHIAIFNERRSILEILHIYRRQYLYLTTTLASILPRNYLVLL